jgi:Fe2+ transport system protein FeoA
MRALKRAKPRGIPLSDLRVGESARVVSMDLDEETAWKFRRWALGRASLAVGPRAPLGDPMELELLGYHLAVSPRRRGDPGPSLQGSVRP